jgi:hypothetical protein
VSLVIDCHAHLRTPGGGDPERLLEAADRAGVDRLILCSLGREWMVFPDAATLEQANADIVEVLERYPDRLMGLVYLSADDVALGLEHLNRYIANGPCVGVKLWVSQLADDPRMDPLFDRIVELDVPVLQHTWFKATGNLEKESTAWHCVNRAELHPGLKMWLAHAGGQWEETARIIAPYPNLCVDISGGEPEAGVVDCLLRHIGPERIFFGSDIPGRSLIVQMSKVLSAEIPDGWKEMILGENILRWVRP